MLVLARKVGESIILRMPDGTECTITVTKTSRWSAKLGISAPQTVRVLRSELDGLDDAEE